MIKSPLLLYRKLRGDLEGIGFEVNPYDICVMNTVVDGNQITVAFHVDDLKVSHADHKVVDDFVAWIKRKYEDPKIKKDRTIERENPQLPGNDPGFQYSRKGQVDNVRLHRENVGRIWLQGTVTGP
jgi:hypothetical protein